MIKRRIKNSNIDDPIRLKEFNNDLYEEKSSSNGTGISEVQFYIEDEDIRFWVINSLDLEESIINWWDFEFNKLGKNESDHFHEVLFELTRRGIYKKHQRAKRSSTIRTWLIGEGRTKFFDH